MSTIVTAVSAQQILSALLAEEEHRAQDPARSELLSALRPDVPARTREAYDALFRTEQALPAPVLHALAATTAAWQGSGPLADHHRDQGAETALLTDGPITGDHHGLGEQTLQGLRDHVDLLSTSPARTAPVDHERLAGLGVSPTVTVLVSQLVAFESYLQRLVAGLAALAEATIPSAAAPERTPAARGRSAHAPDSTITGRERPRHFTREVLQWEPWISVPGPDELTAAQQASFAAKSTTNSVYFRMLSLTPETTAARSALDNAIFLPRDGLPKAERELAATVASKVNDCIYCASVHARKAAGLSKRPEDVDRLLASRPDRDADGISTELAPLAAGQDERWATLIDVSAQLSRPCPAITPEHIGRLRALGLAEAEVADLITASAFFAWANRLMLSLGEPSVPDEPSAP